MIEDLDEIGYWSEVKLDIVREYASAYSRILSARKNPPFEHAYIDAFAGAGIHISKTRQDFIPGSPLNALWVEPPFKQYYFIDINESRVKALEEIKQERDNVTVYHGDCNNILLDEIFPKLRWDQRKRALCLLDPYGMHLDWRVIQKAGELGTIEIFLNFPIEDINRNALPRDRSKVKQSSIERMNRFWGDDSWTNIAFVENPNINLFGLEDMIKTSNDVVVAAFRDRLKKIAGFDYVAEPMPMRNTNNAVVYYLLFASPKAVATKIVKDIFRKYKDRRS
jgi:three-Cys-motif partner protein